jgi:hypothetical protein
MTIIILSREESFMSDEQVVYTSQVLIERQEGPDRLAWLPTESDPVHLGVHGAVAEFYGLKADDLSNVHATTLDYVVAAAGG